MKKVFAILTTAAMMTSLAACGGGSKPAATTAAPAATTAAAAAETKAAETEAAQSDKPSYTLSIGFTTAPSDYDPYNITSLKFKEYVEEATNGRIAVDVYPSGQLGSETEMFESMQVGTLDMGIVTNAYVSAYVPACGALDLPFLFSDLDQARSVVDGEFGQKLVDAVSTSGVTTIGWSEGGFRNTPTVKKSVKTPDDIKGMKIRCMETKTYLAAYAALDVNATPMAWGELLTALQQGTVDGCDIPNSVTYANGFADIADYYNMLGMFYSPLHICISTSVYNKFDDEDKQILCEAAKKAGQFTRAKNDENDEFMLGEMKNQGLEIIPPEEIDFAAFQEKGSKCWTSPEMTSYIGQEYIDALMKALGK